MGLSALIDGDETKHQMQYSVHAGTASSVCLSGGVGVVCHHLMSK